MHSAELVWKIRKKYFKKIMHSAELVWKIPKKYFKKRQKLCVKWNFRYKILYLAMILTF